jgi:FkbM family methyltransferase
MSIILTDFKYGKIFVSDKDIFIGKTLLVSGQYCDEEVDIFKQLLKPNDNVIEVGANIGSLAIPISQIIGTGLLYCFEPQQYIYNMLCANIAVNNASNIRPIKCAIGDIEGKVTIPSVNYEELNNFGGIEINGYNVDGEDVDLITLDNHFKNLEQLKLIKIDVEGMEIDVLNGGKSLINKHRPFIYCENDRQDKSEELVSILKKLNYRIYEHISYVFNKKNYNNDDNNPFNKNYICINILAIPKELELPCVLNEINKAEDSSL